MTPSFDLSDKEAGMKLLEDLTSNVRQTQDDVLVEILTRSANTEYLRRFLDGRSDKHLFKKNVPVVKYEDLQPYIERIANGEPSDVLSGRPITAFLLSSGTSGGVQKKMPWNTKYLDNLTFIYDLRMILISKHVDGVEHGKGLMFLFAKQDSKTPSGLPTKYATSSYFKSDYFKNRPLNWYYSYTSPDEVILCTDNKQSLYCHLLCGLVQRDQVSRVGSIFASVLVRVIKSLEDLWKELCSNIRSGHVSEWITDPGCKNSVSLILDGPNPELADMIEQECKQESWKGIITRLWPGAKCIETVITGSMIQYVPTLEFYSNGLPIVSTTYGSSETTFGINLDLHNKPEDISYTFMPNMSYFEFLPVEENKDTSTQNFNSEEDQIVDLIDLKVGHYYEPVVTNFSGLYRMRVGDVLLVTGFYNNAPQFRFVRRENVVLSIDEDKTNEEDLLKAVTNAKSVLDGSDLMLMDFTSMTDTSSIPGHYVLYWELKGKGKNGVLKIDSAILEECCFTVEGSLDTTYKICRSKYRSVGALEIRVVKQGTFDSLMDFFISQGSSIGQYKTPRCIKSAKALEVLEDRVVASFFSQKCP